MTDIRYGIYLRPDPATCWNVTQTTLAVKRQFGLVSAGAFPPHATLIGNLASAASVPELVAALDPVFEGLQPFPVYNAGVVRTASNTWEFNVDLDENAAAPNEPLRAAALAVKDAVLPLSVPVNDYLVRPVAAYTFAGHLGLASHELLVDDSLSDQVGEFIQQLPIEPAPPSFSARWFSLFEFRADWSGPWWEHMTWRHLHSWEVL